MSMRNPLPGPIALALAAAITVLVAFPSMVANASGASECGSAAQCIPVHFDADACPNLQGTDPGHVHANRSDRIRLEFDRNVPENVYLILRTASSSPLASGRFSIQLPAAGAEYEFTVADDATVGKYEMMIVNLATAACTPLDFTVFVDREG